MQAQIRACDRDEPWIQARTGTAPPADTRSLLSFHEDCDGLHMVGLRVDVEGRDGVDPVPMFGERRRVTCKRGRIACDVDDDRRTAVRDLMAHFGLRAGTRRVEHDDVGMRALRIDVLVKRVQHVAAQCLHGVDSRVPQVPARVGHGVLRPLDAHELGTVVEQCGEGQREQATPNRDPR